MERTHGKASSVAYERAQAIRARMDDVLGEPIWESGHMQHGRVAASPSPVVVPDQPGASWARGYASSWVQTSFGARWHITIMVGENDSAAFVAIGNIPDEHLDAIRAVNDALDGLLFRGLAITGGGDEAALLARLGA